MTKNEVREEKKKIGLKPGQIVPIYYDPAFKRMWGDESGKERVALLLSKYFNMEFYYVLNNIEFVNIEHVKDNKSDMERRSDIMIKLKLKTPTDEVIDLEMNSGIYNPNIERNIDYIARMYSTNFKIIESNQKNPIYKVDYCIQINFNRTFINKERKDIIEEYYLRDKHGHILSDKIKIVEINIAECSSLWYSGDINEISNESSDLLRLGALMSMEKKEDFDKCLEEINMDDKVKDSIKTTSEIYNDDNTFYIPWTAEFDKMATDNLNHINMMKEVEDARRKVEEEAEESRKKIEEEAEESRKKMEEEAEESRKKLEEEAEESRKKMVEEVEKSKEELIQHGIEEGRRAGTLDVINSMLKENVDIEVISKVIGLSIQEINALK